MKKYISQILVLAFFSALTLTSCKKDGVVWDPANPFDGLWKLNWAPIGLAPIIDASDDGIDAYLFFGLHGELKLQFVNWGGKMDPGTVNFYRSGITFPGYYTYDGKELGINFNPADTLFVTDQRKFALAWINGTWTCEKGGTPPGVVLPEKAKSMTLNPKTAETQQSWIIVREGKDLGILKVSLPITGSYGIDTSKSGHEFINSHPWLSE